MTNVLHRQDFVVEVYYVTGSGRFDLMVVYLHGLNFKDDIQRTKVLRSMEPLYYIGLVKELIIALVLATVSIPNFLLGTHHLDLYAVAVPLLGSALCSFHGLLIFGSLLFMGWLVKFIVLDSSLLLSL